MLAIRLLCVLMLPTAVANTWAQTVPLMDVLASELTRNFDLLKAKGAPPAYFLSYTVTDTSEDEVRASMGSLIRSGSERRRLFDCTVRLGSPQFDNYHRLEGQPAPRAYSVPLPLEDVSPAIRRIVWAETDKCYQSANARMKELSGRAEIDASKGPAIADFSAGARVVAISKVEPKTLDREAWAKRVRNLSGAFREFPGVLSSEMSVIHRSVIRILVNTEGTRLRTGSNVSRVTLSSRAKAADGEDLMLEDTFDAIDPLKLPNDQALLQALIAQADLLTRLRRAPEADPFAGPAIFSARAAATLFLEVMARGLESRKGGAEPAPLFRLLNKPVLPDTFQVVSAPTIANAGVVDLIGSYSHDDEAVAARPVVLVDKGVLKDLLTSRTPVAGFPGSNGHGRAQSGHYPVARQSNLFVDSTKPVTSDELKKQLIAEATRQKKPYGLYIDRLRVVELPAQAPAPARRILVPTALYRIFVDGHKDELVRGVFLSGDLMKIFEKTMGSSDYKQAVSFFDEGDSGEVPVSVVAPALLVSEVGLQRTVKPTDRPPFLPRPQPTGY